MIMYHKETNKPAKVGDRVKSFRGEVAFINRMVEPLHAASTGRVEVNRDGNFVGEYFPSVYGLEWRDK